MQSSLNEGLKKRQQKIKDVKYYLQITEELFVKYGQKELGNISTIFENISKAFASDEEVKLVVIGEFSRGKSTLVNALLDIMLLRSAQEATTAINTFVKKLPKDKSKRFIRIIFLDDTPSKDLEWPENDMSVLDKWGTELDKTNANVRELVDRIEIYTSHPLLDQGLVLIDTPGLQSVVEHHEAVTRRAIDQSHIAIWVQSTQQLGGNETEWKFLSETVTKNFNKFLTVINMWDTVLEPQDKFDQETPLEEREQKKYDIIKNNFKNKLPNVSSTQLDTITSPDNLFGISASWGLLDDEDKKSRSNIGKLSQRISDMLSSGEALEEIYRKPMRQLQEIQKDLQQSITEGLKQLQSDKSLEEREQEIKKLTLEIEKLELDITKTNAEFKDDHERNAKYIIDDLKQTLVEPLKELKEDIEDLVTTQYIKSQIEKKVKSIHLPADLQKRYHDVTESIDEVIEKQGSFIQKTLEALRSEYNNDMSKHVKELDSQVSSLNFSMPSLDLTFDVDFSQLDEYLVKQNELDDQIEGLHKELEEAEHEKRINQVDPEKYNRAEAALRRVEANRRELGSRPSPQQKNGTREVPRWGVFGWLGGKKTESYSDEDDSNVKYWEHEVAQAKQDILGKESYLQKIQEEEEAKGKKRMSAERAEQQYQKELMRRERDARQIQAKAEQEKASQIENIHSQLVGSTAGTLNTFVRNLEKQVKPNIEQIFNAQMDLLSEMVKDKLQEPLHAKLAQRTKVEKTIQAGKEQIEIHRQSMEKGLKEINQLIAQTNDAADS